MEATNPTSARPQVPTENAPPDQEQSTSKTSSSRRPRSKISRLPKLVRDRLNIMLLDGVPYAEILTTLGDVAAGITEQNLSTWAGGRYKEWLAEQHSLEETRVRQEVAMDFACPEGGSKIHEATLQLAATRLTEIVRNLDPDDFQQLLRDDPAKIIPFLNSLATISNAELRCERHRAELAAASAPASAKPAGLTRDTRLLLEKELQVK